MPDLTDDASAAPAFAFAGGPPATPARPSAAPSAPAGQAGTGPTGGGGEAATLADTAKQKLSGALGERKNAAADFVETLAGSVQRSGEQFEGQQDWIASAIGRGAAELNTIAGSLRDKDLGTLAGDVQAFAVRQPALFVGASLAAGFALARLGKVVAGDLSRDDLPTIPPVTSEAGHGQS